MRLRFSASMIAILVDTLSTPSANFLEQGMQTSFKNSDFNYLIEQSSLLINLTSSDPAQ